MPTSTEPYKQEPYIEYNAVANVLRQRFQLYKDRPMVHYETPDGTFKTLTFEQVGRITTNLAKKWAPEMEGVTTMAFLADHSVFYFIALLTLFKLRVQVMLLSPRNSEAAHVNLLNKTKASHLFVSEKYSDIAHKAVQKVEEGLECKIKVLATFHFMDILNEDSSSEDNELDYTFSEKDRSEIVVICQSSGTTSLPKPIRLSNEYFLYDWQLQLESVAENFPKIATGPDDVLMTVFPLFHIFGIHIHFSLLLRGASVVFFERLPPSPQQLLNATKLNHVTKAALPPILLRNLQTYFKETNDDMTPLQQLKYIIYGGAPLPIDIGRWYHERGVNVCNVYGTTEMGGKGISDFTGKDGHEFWSKVRFIEPMLPYIEWEPYDNAERIYHLVIKAGCPFLASNVANREDGSYATSDLFREDMPGSGYYTILGRKDDTLVMENGEKTNPLIIEHTIAGAEPIISNCCVIAEGRQCTALLVEIDVEKALECTPQEMIDRVSKAVKEGNKVAPNYSTILPQMVHILPLKKRLATTDKGTLKRKEIYEQNAEVIEAMYDRFLKGSPKNNGKGAAVSSHDIESFVIESAAECLGIESSELAQNKDKSLFDYGLNSLLATQLMNVYSQQAKDLPSNFLYEHPTVESIVKYLREGGKNRKTAEDHYQETQDILKAYLARADKDFDKVPAKAPQPPSDGHVVLLTGATGSLGSFMLRDMLQSPQVKKVYAMVRQRFNESLFGRLEKAFRDRHLDTNLLYQTDKLEALPMTLEKDNLGFSQEQYDTLKKEVTMVQACAWLLDFNQPISHFEKECLRGLYNLLKFAYRPENPMHVHHISSVSAAGAMKMDAIPETITPQDPHVAMAMGYGQSKYIVEHLFDYLCKEKNFPCVIERMGQVCGDSINGVWNTSEQYPLMMVGGGALLKKMPDFGSMELDWLPVDYASISIFEIMLETAKQQGSEIAGKVFHIVNPNTANWIDLLQAMKLSGIEFEVVPVSEWVQELKQHPENPAYRLMAFYEAGHGALPHWETNYTTQVSESLAKSPSLNSNLVIKFFNYWQSVGFYNPSSSA